MTKMVVVMMVMMMMMMMMVVVTMTAMKRMVRFQRVPCRKLRGTQEIRWLAAMASFILRASWGWLKRK